MRVSWIFGYGSLIWRPAFSFEAVAPASLRGWRRRFWQGSPDHRGTPAAPGRVVTLVCEPASICRGLAFRIHEHERDAVIAQLDVRESGGYERLAVDIELDDGQTVPALTYVAPPHNANFLGPASEALLVQQIAASTGASGANREYVLRLAEALASIDAADDHVTRLAALLGAGDAPRA